ncbi:hypothetical protein DN069_34615 [Streptacidiphilus pinicola]|uniref:Blue (type 1) copper domain-containing protein n=1 Tax=Streptacidiphilus pinicola TaxID=2219663 RepID=A0A2X0K160_9ACTN|nr:hypothetical protein [Streptacidiphilus pinicola]RAG81090.1 hypothetical protein DN069_34615 [Streptacidiphilus pinicola]
MPRHPALVAGALLLSLAATGCSSSKSSTASNTPSNPASAPTTTPTPATAAGGGGGTGGGTTVTVDETEFSLHLSQSTFPAGKYTFVAQDSGHISHALAISGPGLPTTQTAVIGPGGSSKLTVTLQKGAYELWCPVDSHKSLGMDTHIQVS